MDEAELHNTATTFDLLITKTVRLGRGAGIPAHTMMTILVENAFEAAVYGLEQSNERHHAAHQLIRTVHALLAAHGDSPENGAPRR